MSSALRDVIMSYINDCIQQETTTNFMEKLITGYMSVKTKISKNNALTL